jgi:hypothetical protein
MRKHEEESLNLKHVFSEPVIVFYALCDSIDVVAV